MVLDSILKKIKVLKTATARYLSLFGFRYLASITQLLFSKQNCSFLQCQAYNLFLKCREITVKRWKIKVIGQYILYSTNAQAIKQAATQT